MAGKTGRSGRRGPGAIGAGFLLAALVAAGPGQTAAGGGVTLVLDQAEAALEILQLQADGRIPHEAAWERLFESEGHTRLRERQESFGATEVDDWMRRHLEDPATIARLDPLRQAVERWRTIDTRELEERALRYLPPGSTLSAKLYPVIKSSTNSFVWQLGTDPAIFAHVDPSRSAEKLANTMVHELHHVGAGACAEPAGRDGLAPGARDALDWTSGFAEGLAMLVAAGSPDVHPHATSKAGEWAIWERDIARFANDVGELDSFFLGLIDGLWDAEEQRERGFRFINTAEVPQGAFYTVGWKMAALVERMDGRAPIVTAACDPRILLAAYDRIAGELTRPDADPLPRWSPRLLLAVGATDPAPPER